MSPFVLLIQKSVLSQLKTIIEQSTKTTKVAMEQSLQIGDLSITDTNVEILMKTWQELQILPMGGMKVDR